MKVRDVEDRVRGMRRPEPSRELRVRVLNREPVPERPVTWTARVASDTAARAPQLEVVDTSRRGWDGWRRSGVLIALSALLIVGSCTGFDVVEGHRVEAEIARLEAKYGSLDLSTLNVPAVPDADNRARVVRAAAALAVGLPGSKYYHLEFNGPAPVPPNLRAFAEANHDAIRLAGDVLTRRQSSWGIDYRHRLEDLPYEPIRILSDAIFLTALLELEAGRADDATRMVVIGLGVSASLRQEPDQFAQYMRSGMAGPRLIEAIREILTRSAPSPGALADLASWLAENRTPDPTFMTAISGLKNVNAMFARMENGDIDPNTASWIYPMTWPSWPSRFLGPAARIGRPFVRKARLQYLQYMEQLLDIVSSPRPHPALPEFPAPQRWALVDRLTDKFTTGATRDAGYVNDFFSELSAAEVAVALRRFKLDRGTYPDDLSVLAPRYLDSLPIDPYTGRAPVYARQGAGFILRATGRNPGISRTLEWNVSK